MSRLYYKTSYGKSFKELSDSDIFIDYYGLKIYFSSDFKKDKFMKQHMKKIEKGKKEITVIFIEMLCYYQELENKGIRIEGSSSWRLFETSEYGLKIEPFLTN